MKVKSLVVFPTPPSSFPYIRWFLESQPNGIPYWVETRRETLLNHSGIPGWNPPMQELFVRATNTVLDPLCTSNLIEVVQVLNKELAALLDQTEDLEIDDWDKI